MSPTNQAARLKLLATKYKPNYDLLSWVLLTVLSAYSLFEAAKVYATGSDALVYTYLLKGARPDQIVLPGQHANILKLPFFWLTSLFPYNRHTFILASVLLALASVLLWGYLLIRIFGKRYTVLILLLLASLVFTSTQFSINIAENTIRNIEFPLALWFILIVNDVLKDKPLTTLQKRVGLVGVLLYSVLLSGDNYFFIACSLAQLLVIGLSWLQGQQFSRPMAKAAGLIVLTAVVSLIIRAFLSVTHLVVINQHIAYPTTVVPLSNLAPSITTALTQLLNLQSANIFGQTLGTTSLSVFINFGILLLEVAAVICILFVAIRTYRKKSDISRHSMFVLASLAVSYVVTFWVYIFSGQVVQTVNGQIVSLGQIRYIAFMPLLGLAALVWFINRYYRKHTWLIRLVIAMLFVQLIVAYPSVNNSYHAQIATAQPPLGQLEQVATYLESQHVHEALTGYWNGSPLRFVSNSQVNFATIVNCNHPFTFNVRTDWYTPQANINSALVIDRTGIDKAYWVCSDEQLRQIYGVPVAIKSIGNLSIWTYHYDTRQRLTTYKLTYY